ncbi:hypothetical protein CQW23_35360 [Capsicum baccatum]|uniref:Uncharacterized protein n=1 Tax=Capsicum baccatum TaxID=33114 RepID=A0A2G2UWC7_CAPBA|nr:hypothetical protein CQW23_35360 [Capsicum baccatum]
MPPRKAFKILDMNRNLLLVTKDESGERVQQQHNVIPQVGLTSEKRGERVSTQFGSSMIYLPRGMALAQRIKSGRTIQLESLCDFTKDEELQDNSRPVRPNGKEEPAVVVTSSGSKEEVRPNGNEERATVLKSSGSTEELLSLLLEIR